MFDFDPTEGAGAAVELSGVWESSQVCPACGASEEEAPGTISYSSYDGEYREIWQNARCSRCEAVWSESYYMQGATGDGEGGFAVLAGSLLDAAFDVLASGGDGLSLRTLGDAVRGIVGVQGATELERRREELAGPCLCGMNTSLGCRSQCALVQAPCPGCGGSGEYILSTWAPVYVTVSDGQVTRVRVNDEALDVAGLPERGVISVVTCAGCDARQGDATADAVRAAADASESWPGWEWM